MSLTTALPAPGRTDRELTPGQARRTAIAAQLLAGSGPESPDGSESPDTSSTVNRGHLRRLTARLGVLQIDSVNVLARAHLVPIFSRLGPYPLALLDQAAWPARSRDRMLVETWAHEASLVPAELHPLLRWERRHWSAASADRMRTQHPGLLEDVLAVVAEHGPCSAGQVERLLSTGARKPPGWWEWSESKRACEALFSAGLIGTAYRRGFERHYDLMDRVLPPAVLAMPTPEPADAKRALVALAARAYGVATVADLADYFRMPVADARIAVLDLVEAGTVRPVRVRGWRDQAYLHTAAAMPRTGRAQALLCPFDPLIWERSRTERLFGFRYRIEIYTPEPKRIYGYYVFPLLLGDQLVGRFDLKADRATGVLLVQAAWVEPGADPAVVAAAAMAELSRMARWLQLTDIEVRPRGDLARVLAAVVADRGHR